MGHAAGSVRPARCRGPHTERHGGPAVAAICHPRVRPGVAFPEPMRGGLRGRQPGSKVAGVPGPCAARQGRPEDAPALGRHGADATEPVSGVPPADRHGRRRQGHDGLPDPAAGRRGQRRRVAHRSHGWPVRGRVADVQDPARGGPMSSRTSSRPTAPAVSRRGPAATTCRPSSRGARKRAASWASGTWS